VEYDARLIKFVFFPETVQAILDNGEYAASGEGGGRIKVEAQSLASLLSKRRSQALAAW
jgi:hypothetical protein